jgi:hypothetical protein
MYRQMRDVGSLESSTFLIRMHYTKWTEQFCY